MLENILFDTQKGLSRIGLYIKFSVILLLIVFISQYPNFTYGLSQNDEEILKFLGFTRFDMGELVNQREKFNVLDLKIDRDVTFRDVAISQFDARNIIQRGVKGLGQVDFTQIYYEIAIKLIKKISGKAITEIICGSFPGLEALCLINQVVSKVGTASETGRLIAEIVETGKNKISINSQINYYLCCLYETSRFNFNNFTIDKDFDENIHKQIWIDGKEIAFDGKGYLPTMGPRCTKGITMGSMAPSNPERYTPEFVENLTRQAWKLAYANYILERDKENLVNQIKKAINYKGLITKAYRDILKRDPEPIERDYYIIKMIGGLNVEQIRERIAKYFANPEIASISPIHVQSGKFTLTINGSNFDSGAVDQVYKGDRYVTQGRVVNRIPPHQIIIEENFSGFQAGNYAIRVKNSDGKLSNPINIVVTSTTSQPPTTQLPSAVIDSYNRLGGVSVFGDSLPQNYTISSGVASTGTSYKAVELSRGGIYESSKGIFVVYGAIYQKYRSIGGPKHFIGLPISNEADGPRSPQGTTGRFSRFERGSINWLREKNQTFLVQGAIFEKWASLGSSGSQLGFPISDEYPYQGGARSDFEGGSITWTSETGAQVVLKGVSTPTQKCPNSEEYNQPPHPQNVFTQRYRGYCTWYVADRWLHAGNPELPSIGNAERWWKDAEEKKFPRGNEPKEGSIIVFGPTDKNRAGHVAYVESVRGSEFTIDQMNAGKNIDRDLKTECFNKVTRDTLQISQSSYKGMRILGFIYPQSFSPPPGCTDGVQFVADVTIPDNTPMQPGQGFTKTWRLRNTGNCPWGSGYSLVFVGGSQMGAPSSVSVPSVSPNATGDISVSMVAPSASGVHQGYWQMRNPQGKTFGPQIWVKINVTSTSISNLPPNLPTNLSQFRSDGVTGIGVGATTNESTSVFKGGVSDPNNDTVKLQIELRRLDEYGGQFTGTPTQESSSISSGSTATISVYGLVNGSYHWRARTIDSKGATSNWLSAGNNPDSAADLVVSVGVPPPPPPPFACVDSSQFVVDVTIPDNTQVQAGQSFTKSWRLRNSGTCSWGSGYSLVFVGGTQMGAPSSVSVPSVPQNGTGDISVPMVAPSTTGAYQGNWQMRNPKGQAFGPQIWVKINVVSGPPPPPPPPTCTDGVQFVADVTIPDGTQVQAGQSFTKSWRLRNSGTCSWGSGYSLAFVSGSQMGAPSSGSVPSVPQNGTGDISVPMVAPSTTGAYQGYWQMRNSKGQSFGPQIGVKINVAEVAVVEPKITSFSPSQVQAGQFTITINGSNFDSGAIDQFYTPSGQYMGSGAQSGGLVSRTSNQIVVRENLTGAQPGTYTIRVKNSDEKLSNPINIIVTAATVTISPTVSMSPQSGSVGTNFAQTGRGFTPNNKATLYGRRSDGSVWQITTLTTDSSGAFSQTWTAQTPGNNFAWWAVDSLTGKKSNEVVYNIIPPISTNLPPNPPAQLSQLRSDGVTGIGVGAKTNEKTVVFKAGVSDPNNDTVKLQIELRRLDEYGGQFTGSPTQESSFVSSGSVATITVYGLINGSYHWRARTIDSKGATSNWLSAGNNPDSAADFAVSVGVPPPPPPPPTCTDGVQFVADVTIPDGTQMPHGQGFTKTWRLRNTGTCSWGSGYSLVFVSGSQMGAPASVSVAPTSPNGTADISVTMTAPSTPGIYQGNWQMRNLKGQPFGTPIYVKINVASTPPLPPPPVCTDGAQFVADVAIPDGTQMQPGQKFAKIWRLKNTGTCAWGSGYSLVFVGGSQMGASGSVPVLPTSINGTTDIGVPMVAPPTPGIHQGHWQMRNPKGQAFGPQIWVKINVASAPSTLPPTPTPPPPKTVPQSISARIDDYAPRDPNNPVRVQVGGSTPLSVSFTNTGNTAWRFIVGASVWDSKGKVVGDYSTTLSAPLQLGQQTSVSWSHPVREAGDYWVQFGVWKAAPFVGENLLEKKPAPAQKLIVGVKK